nr:hypothetical protein CFP56_40980 [Quercus suber]
MTYGNQVMIHGNHGGKNGNSKKERPVCTYCGIVDHVADKCCKLHKYPPGYKHKGKASANQVSSSGSGSFGSSFATMEVLGILPLSLCKTFPINLIRCIMLHN